jgi:hypothetical protein
MKNKKWLLAIMATVFLHFLIAVNKTKHGRYSKDDILYWWGNENSDPGYYFHPFWVLNGIYLLYFIYAVLLVLGVIKLPKKILQP